jgi:ribosome-associated protein
MPENKMPEIAVKARSSVRKNDPNTKKLVKTIVFGMEEKKALDIKVLDLRKLKHAVADYFIVCSGNSDSQVDAIMDSVEEEVEKKIGEQPWRKEGQQNKEWILIDYIDVVVHIFKTGKREFYGLEDLWGDAKIVTVNTQE